jgi:uncharacterized protein
VQRLVLSLALAVCAFGADWTQLKPEGYLSDFARVVDADSRASIDAYLTALERDTGAQIAIVTIETLDGEMVDDVANKLYRQFGVGVKGKNEGALFLLVVKDRKSRLEVGYGLEGIVPDGVAGDILRSMRPALRAEQYGPGLIEATRVLGTKIAAGKNVTLTGQLPERQRFDQQSDPPQRELSSKEAQILVGVAVLVVFLLMSRSGRRGRGGGTWILPGGGGFGGGGSAGSSWGGFGGGDSGGGGASSDW